MALLLPLLLTGQACKLHFSFFKDGEGVEPGILN
jgi:hypothetical protein